MAISEANEWRRRRGGEGRGKIAGEGVRKSRRRQRRWGCAKEAKRGEIGGEEGIEQLNRKRHNGPGWLWRRVIKWVPHSHTAA